MAEGKRTGGAGNPEGRARYRVYVDGIFSGLRPTDEPVDGYEVFASFSEAKAALVVHLASQANQYRLAAREARQLRKADVTEQSSP